MSWPAPCSFTFYDTVVFRRGTDVPGTRAGIAQSVPVSGVTLSCYVETSVDRQARSESETPATTVRYHIFLPTDPGCVVDDQFAWRGKTLSALGPAVLQGSLWFVECQEVR
jgi:hypothetical protein